MIVRCADCDAFTADPHTPAGGVGRCKHGITMTREANGSGRLPLWSQALRQCERFSRVA